MWMLILLFVLPTILVWRKAFVAYVVVVGGTLVWTWNAYFWTSPDQDLDGDGTLVLALLSVVTMAAVLGVIFRAFARPAIQKIAARFRNGNSSGANGKSALNGWRVAGSGFVLGTFGWLVAAQFADVAGWWLAIASGTTLATLGLFEIVKSITQSKREQRNSEKS